MAVLCRLAVVLPHIAVGGSDAQEVGPRCAGAAEQAAAAASAALSICLSSWAASAPSMSSRSLPSRRCGSALKAGASGRRKGEAWRTRSCTSDCVRSRWSMPKASSTRSAAGPSYKAWVIACSCSRQGGGGGGGQNRRAGERRGVRGKLCRAPVVQTARRCRGRPP